MLLGPVRLVIRIFGLIVAAILIYFAVTMVQVWLTSRQDSAHPAGAILVMGAAQYNGVPSPDLRARLDEALALYRHGDARLIVVTGGKEVGDVFTEAQAGARYLESNQVPSSAILEAGGNDSYENISDAAPQLVAHHVSTVLVTTDPFHEYRSMAIASAFKLTPSPTPTRTSPITGWSTVPYFAKEAIGVGLGRIVGYNHIEWLHNA